MFFYHYFENIKGPFLNLSDLSLSDAKEISLQLKAKDGVFASKRDEGYLERRLELEKTARDLFIRKGGQPVRKAPHYMVVEECPWLQSWYLDGSFVKIAASEFDVHTISFTYGDMFPTFSPKVCDGKEYRGQLYTYPEILELIGRYGLPQIWNADGKFGPERYIEVQVWSDNPVARYIEAWKQAVTAGRQE